MEPHRPNVSRQKAGTATATAGDPLFQRSPTPGVGLEHESAQLLTPTGDGADEVFHPAWEGPPAWSACFSHDLPHTTATQLYDLGCKIEEAANVLGDTAPTVEATYYVHVFEPRSRSTW